MTYPLACMMLVAFESTTPTARAQCDPLQVSKLLAADGEESDRFGFQVAVFGRVAVVTAYLDDVYGDNNAGSVYAFNLVTQRLIAKIVTGDGQRNNWFGYSVALNDRYLVVGVPGDDDIGTDAGSVYQFDLVTRQQVRKIFAQRGQRGDRFGHTVGISDNTIIVTAPGYYFGDGAAYVFDADSGLERYRLESHDGTSDDSFGSSVAISGEFAVIGAPYDDDFGEDCGAAYLFNTASGLEGYKLRPDVGSADHHFGAAVAIDGTTIIVGTPLDDVNGIRSGAAYLFDTTTGMQIAKILSDAPLEREQFGNALAVNGTTLLIGAYGNDDRGYHAGAAYLFDLNCLPRSDTVYHAPSHARPECRIHLCIRHGQYAGTRG